MKNHRKFVNNYRSTQKKLGIQNIQTGKAIELQEKGKANKKQEQFFKVIVVSG